MSIRTLRMSLSALAATALLLLAGPSRAGIWSSDYDPPAIGSGTFDVPAACLSVGDGQHNPGGAGCLAIQILTNVATTPAVNFFMNLPSSAISSYEVIGGQFVGVNTAIIGSTQVGTINYWFQFLSTFNPPDGETGPSVTNFVNIYTDGCDGRCTTPAFVADRVTFALVPEPGSIGLILGALGAGWLARRRKTAT